MKIMKRIPIIIAVIHGGFSLSLFGISLSMPSVGIGGGIGYATAFAAFIINLPGVLTIRQFYTSSPTHTHLVVWTTSIGMILITDIYLFLFLMIIGWMIDRRRNFQSARGEL